jgi:hypothetical protein
MKSTFLIFTALGITISLVSCTKDKTTQPSVPNTKTKDITVNFSNTTSFTLFSFKDTTVVANTDSISTKWDFALRLTTFLVNSNSGGPGNAGVIMQDGVFDNIKTAPATGYAYDTTSSQRAIKDGSWYDYNPTTRSFVPKAGKVFIFRTGDGAHYAKMELLSANYAPFTGPVPQQIIYKIRFTYQPDGSKNF